MYSRKYKKASSKIAQRRKVRKYVGLSFKIFLAAAFLAVAVFVLRADFMQVADFEVLGARNIPQESIKNMAGSFVTGTKFLLVPKSNILLLNKEKLASVLLSEFGRLQKVEINKQFFGKKIELLVVERGTDFLWCLTAQTGTESGECFFMTGDGLVFEKSDFADNPTGKIIFRGVLGENPLMKNFASAQKMQNYLKLIETFKKSGFEIVSINIESGDRAVAKTKINNTISDIIFNPEEADPSSVAQNVILLINDVKSKNSSARFEYLDARFGNKIFYKLL